MSTDVTTGTIRWGRARLVGGRTAEWQLRSMAIVCLANVVALWGIQRIESAPLAVFCGAFLLYVDIAIAAIICRVRHERIDVLEPLLVVIGLYTLYGWAAPLGELTATGEFIDILPAYYTCLLIGLVGLIAGYEIHRSERLVRFRFLAAPIPLPSRRRFHLLVIALAALLVLVNVRFFAGQVDVGSLKPYTETAAASRVGRTGASALASESQDLALAAVIVAIFLPAFAARRLPIVPFLLFAAYAVIGVMAGGKFLLISFVTVILMLVNYRIRPIPLTAVALAGAVLYAFVTLFSHVRSTTSLKQMYELGSQIVSADPTLLNPGRAGEFAGPPRTLMNVITAIQSGRFDYSYGRTYLNDVATLIPRVLFPDRPLPTSEYYMETFYPGRLAAGEGEGNFLATEGFWAFGYVGVFLAMFVYGAIISLVYRFVRTNIDNDAIVIIYSLAFMPLITAAMRTGLVGSLKVTGIMSFTFAVLYMLSRVAPGIAIPARGMVAVARRTERH